MLSQIPAELTPDPLTNVMKKGTLLILALSIAALFQGCEDKSSKLAAAAPQKKLRLGFIANNANNYWSLIRLGCDTAVRQAGDVDLDFRTCADRAAAAQQEVASNLLASGVEAIAISPMDPENQTEFLNSLADKVLLVCADSDAEKSKRACYIGSDNVAAGTQAAELLKEALPQGGKVALFVGNPNAQNVRERIEGIRKGLADSNLQIVETFVNGAQTTLAEKNAQDALVKYPDLAGMVGLYSYHGLALLTAARTAGRTGQVKILCFDYDSETLAGIAAGNIYGAVIQKPFAIGRQTILCLDKCLHGDKTQLATGKVFVPTAKVTKENIGALQNSLKNIFQE